jgi:fatty-acyl-CoA synthase
LKAGQVASPAVFREYLSDRIAKWWLPDAVVFIDDMPLGATGKIDKKLLRSRYIGHLEAEASRSTIS